MKAFVLGAFLGVPILFTSSLQGDDLIQFNDLQYMGAFRVPKVQSADGSDNGTLNYGGADGLGYNPGNPGSLFITCFGPQGFVAEIGISTPIVSMDITALNRATLLQGCDDPTAGGSNPLPPGGTYIGGLMVYQGKLFSTRYIWYDADNAQKAAFFVKPDTVLTHHNAAGAFSFSNVPDIGFVDGWFSPIPEAWQSKFQGLFISGNNPESIVSRSSWGPDAFAWDPAKMTDVNTPVPTTPLVYYSGAHPTLGTWSDGMSVNNGTSSPAVYWENSGNGYHGAIVPDGSRSILFFGSQGTGPFCYGEPTSDPSLAGSKAPDGATYCYDPTGGGKGNTGYPYQVQIMAYDLDDLAAVVSGSKQPWDLKPYAVWPLTQNLPGLDGKSNNISGGAAYDAAHRLIYYAVPGTDHIEQYAHMPMVYVWKVNTPSGNTVDTTPPMAPIGFDAAVGDKQAVLTWTLNRELDVAGYNLYRSVSENGTYVKQNSNLIVSNTYSQTDLTNGTVYWYKVSAVDTSNNESAKSIPVSATPQASASKDSNAGGYFVTPTLCVAEKNRCDEITFSSGYGNVSVVLYNSRGMKIKELHAPDSVSAKNLSSGVYLAVFHRAGETNKKKFVVVR